MSTQEKPNISISAKFLGPVFSLNGNLSKYRQNILFARNGTGKSFISRALRCVEAYSQNKDISHFPTDVISDEAPNKQGEFCLSQGTTTLAKINFDSGIRKATSTPTNTIFHVFTEDFVQEELRERNYCIDGEITNKITVGSDQNNIVDAKNNLEKAKKAETSVYNTLKSKFENEKIKSLSEKAGVSKSLREYKSLVIDRVVLSFGSYQNTIPYSLAQIILDLDKLKAIPAEPNLPLPRELLRIDDIEWEKLTEALSKTTSPSTVSEKIKCKIEAHHDFFETGSNIIRNENLEVCPFCEQDIKSGISKELIEIYLKYFADEEETHKKILRSFYSSLTHKENMIATSLKEVMLHDGYFEKLKVFLPSKKDLILSDTSNVFEKVKEVIHQLKNIITKKAESLSIPQTFPFKDIDNYINALNALIIDNNAKYIELNTAIKKADEERVSIHRKACEAFEFEFANNHHEELESYKSLIISRADRERELAELEKLSLPSDAKSRVALTFEVMLKQFFASKYSFDKENFTIKRGSSEMARGVSKTLSDGEKTAIAFCYFIATIHKKVTANSDYKRIFLVFDDPVTSMSYDYIFVISQILKNLSISDKGDISVNPSKVGKNGYSRPELLILTHSSYFLNIVKTNRVVKAESVFILNSNATNHTITRLDKYIAPFEMQLRHIYEVTNGAEPDHTTGNSIRAVIEAIGRFCRPDKSKEVSDFLTHIAGEDNIEIKSLMIQNLSHGTYYEETPTPEDLRLACNDALRVVEKYANGQLELLRGS